MQCAQDRGSVEECRQVTPSRDALLEVSFHRFSQFTEVTYVVRDIVQIAATGEGESEVSKNSCLRLISRGTTSVARW